MNAQSKKMNFSKLVYVIMYNRWYEVINYYLDNYWRTNYEEAEEWPEYGKEWKMKTYTLV